MNSTLSTLNISIFTTVLMLIIEGLIYRTEKAKRHLHTFEFWLTYLSYFIVSYLTQNLGPYFVALSTVVWIWRTKAIGKILSDVAGTSLKRSWHKYLLVGSYTLMVSLALAKLNFKYFTLPASIANFIIGLDFILQTKRSLKKQDETITHRLLLFTVFVIFLHILDYPFIRYDHDFTGIGFGIVLLTTILMAVILPAVTIFDLQKDHQKDLEKVLKERVRQLRDQSKFSALGEMTAGIVHEINNPLSIIAHRTSHLRNQVLKNLAAKDVLMRNLDQIEITNERVAKIINSLRKFSKDAKLDPVQRVAVATILEDTLSYCSDRFHQANILLDIEAYPPVDIECRSVQISQVFLNLLNNSFDAVCQRKNPWVKIDFKETPEMIQIFIKDSGPGIPESIRSRIMDPFFSTKSNGGTGLGLSISQGIVEDHHGKLSYDDTAMTTTFVVELPYRQPKTYSI
jgi:signal transduction histidine kinase